MHTNDISYIMMSALIWHVLNTTFSTSLNLFPSNTKANGRKRKNEIRVSTEYKFDDDRFSDLLSALTFLESKPRNAKATFDVMAPPKAVMLMSAKMSWPAIILDPTADHPTPRMMGTSQILTLSGSLVPLMRMPKMTENIGSRALMMCVNDTAPADMATTAPTWRASRWS